MAARHRHRSAPLAMTVGNPEGIPTRASHPPIVTYALIGLLTLLFVAGFAGSPMLRHGFVRNELFGLVPAWLSGAELRPPRFDVVPLWATPLTAALFHGGILPLLASLLALELFGQTVERALGAVPTLLLLVLSAYVGGAVQVFSAPPHTPILGAAAMLAGLVGAATLLCGRDRLTVSVEPFGVALTLPAPCFLLVGLLLLWRGAREATPRDMLTPPDLYACLIGLLCGFLSAGLWRGVTAGWLPARGRRRADHTVPLRLFPLLLGFSLAVPLLSRLLQFR